jgi:hypothetical protein
MITTLGKPVDILDICTFYRRQILPIGDICIFEKAGLIQIKRYMHSIS